MKYRVQVDMNQVHVDEVVEGETAEDVARGMRQQVEARAPFLVKMALHGMDDRTLWRRLVELHNSKRGASEAVPTTAEELLQFGERAGYLTRVD